MAKLVPQNHPALHTIADEVPLSDITTPPIQKVIKDMRAALQSYDAPGFNGVAIAAPQIGVSLRIFLVHNTHPDGDDEDPLPDLVAINPVIVKTSKRKRTIGEGCLSVPDHYGVVTRSTHATIRAYDETGVLYERGASGLLAQIFQHEVDHLDGLLFVEKAAEVWHKDELEKQRRSPRGAGHDDHHDDE
jgi:peptide deformylase